MSDLIRRQDAIDAMEKLYDADLEAYGCEIPEMFDCDRAIEELKKLPSAQPKQQWIPCSDRLPDKEGQYLVTDEAGEVVSIICDVFFHYDDGAPTWLLSQNVKAWMPLPEPYREDES